MEHLENRSPGRPGGIRTPNTRIWSPVLYQLELLAYTSEYDDVTHDA